MNWTDLDQLFLNRKLRVSKLRVNPLRVQGLTLSLLNLLCETGPCCCLDRCVVTNDGLSPDLQVWDLGGDDSGEFINVSSTQNVSCLDNETMSLQTDVMKPTGDIKRERTRETRCLRRLNDYYSLDWKIQKLNSSIFLSMNLMIFLNNSLNSVWAHFVPKLSFVWSCWRGALSSVHYWSWQGLCFCKMLLLSFCHNFSPTFFFIFKKQMWEERRNKLYIRITWIQTFLTDA